MLLLSRVDGEDDATICSRDDVYIFQDVVFRSSHHLSRSAKRGPIGPLLTVMTTQQSNC